MTEHWTSAEDELARVVGFESISVVREAVRRRHPGDRWPPMDVAIELAKLGIPAEDMAVALSAVNLIERFIAPRAAMEDVARFVAHASAIGQLRGPGIYLVVELARAATKLTPQNGAP